MLSLRYVRMPVSLVLEVSTTRNGLHPILHERFYVSHSGFVIHDPTRCMASPLSSLLSPSAPLALAPLLFVRPPSPPPPPSVVSATAATSASFCHWLASLRWIRLVPPLPPAYFPTLDVSPLLLPVRATNRYNTFRSNPRQVSSVRNALSQEELRTLLWMGKVVGLMR